MKDVYLPGITNTLFFDNSFSRLIRQTTKGIDGTGRRVVKAFRTQRAAGGGPIAEGGDFHLSVPTKGKQGTEWLKHLNVYFSLSGPAIRSVKAGVGSYVDIVTEHFQTSVDSHKMDFERQLMGKQDGELAVWSDADVTGTADVTAFDVTGSAFFDTQFLEPGMYIEVRSPSYTTPTLRTAIDGTNSYATIDSVTTGNKRTSTRGTMILNESISANVAQNDWICRKGAYIGNATSLEMNGLRNLISDAVDHSGDTHGVDEATDANYTNCWNLARGTYAWLKSYVVNLTGTTSAAELDEENLLQVLMEFKNTNQGNPNLLVVSPRAMQKYFINATDGNRRFNTMSAISWVGGYEGLGVQIGTDQLMLTSIPSVPANTAFMLNTNDFAFVTATNGYEWLTKGDRILTQKEGSDNQFASAVNDVNLVCYDPKKQAKIYGITEF